MLGFGLARMLVQYIAKSTGASVALLFDRRADTAQFWAIGVSGDGIDLGTPAINLQRAAGRAKPLSDNYILVSDQPTEACVGMAALTGIKSIIHCHANQADEYVAGNALGAARVFTAPPLRTPYCEPVSEWVARCAVLLGESPVGPAFVATFKAWPIGEDMAAQLDRAVYDGYLKADNYVPPVAPPASDRLAAGGPEVHAFWMTVARRLIGLVHLGGLQVDGVKASGHNIGCVLVDANNRILAWGVNTSVKNPTYHAETKCMWMFQHHFPGRAVPEGATLYTTLQSCLMCSATIKRACGSNHVKVIYADADKVKDSALTRGGGAREEALQSVLLQHRRLETGQHLLAAARWDRVRSAFHRWVAHTALPQSDIEEIDNQESVRPFLTAMMQPNRADLDRAEQVLRSEPLPAFIFDAIKARLARAKSPLQGREYAKELAIQRQQASERYTRPRMQVIQGQRQNAENLQNMMANLPYTGGAPVLLLNPVLKEHFYQNSEIQRPGPCDQSRAAALSWNQQRILDLTTQLHALDLLLDVLGRNNEYNQH